MEWGIYILIGTVVGSLIYVYVENDRNLQGSNTPVLAGVMCGILWPLTLIVALVSVGKWYKEYKECQQQKNNIQK